MKQAFFKYLLALASILSLVFNIQAQVSIDRSLIGTAGSAGSNGNTQLNSSIGEPIINTAENSPRFYTQGFQQPVRIVDLVFFDLRVEDASCIGLSNGFASVANLTGCTGPYTILWSNGQTGLENRNLAPGNYSVQITSTDGCVTQTVNFNIETISKARCILQFYTGITPNGDGFNDSWVIDNIEAFPSNEVHIYNRLGNLVWEGTNYNNSSIVWKGENLSGNPSPSDTYFFVFEADGAQEKGWIELTR